MHGVLEGDDCDGASASIIFLFDHIPPVLLPPILLTLLSLCIVENNGVAITQHNTVVAATQPSGEKQKWAREAALLRKIEHKVVLLCSAVKMRCTQRQDHWCDGM